MSADNSTNNNIEFSFVSDLKIVYYKQLSIIDYNAFDKRGKNILSHNLYGDKIIPNCASKVSQELNNYLQKS